MADAEKLKKLAAGRKKLKSYQQEKNKGPKRDDGAPDDSQSDNQHQSNETSESAITENVNDLQNGSHIRSYFSNQPIEQAAINFFDQVTVPQVTTEAENVMNNPFMNYNTVGDFMNLNSTSRTDEAMEDPELQPNLIYEHATVEVRPMDYFTSDNQSLNISPAENLRQLSSQITQLIEPSYDNDNNFSDLEKRNLELASLYENEKLKNSQSQAELQEYKIRITTLEKELHNGREECEMRIKRELGPLQEQLQCHMQTVGILVGEKTELTASLDQLQTLNKQKTDECDDLQARLKTSRSRVADLEKDLTKYKEEWNKFNQLGSQQNQEHMKLKDEIEKMREANIEALQDITELREKLKVVTSENTELQQSTKDISSQLSLANLKIQQLTVGDTPPGGVQLDNIVEEKYALEKQVAELNLMLKNAITERDQASNHYQQYVQQLNTNVSSLAQKLEFTITEKENLMKREQELVRHIGELEKRLQSLQNDRLNFTVAPKVLEIEKSDLESEYESLIKKHDDLEEKFKELITERDDLLRDVESRKETIQEFESAMEQLKGNQTDSARLLATIESDKVAASRAVQQNTQLKQQLEEMQEAFIKMTNDKAELMDNITSEQYKFRELEEKLNTATHQVHTLSEAIAIKDHELTEMRENSLNISKHSSEHHNHHDEHDHHDHEHSCNHEHEKSNNKIEETLQNEIFSLKERIEKLQIENQSLQVKIRSESNSELLNNHKINDVGAKPKQDTLNELNNSHLYELNQELAMQQLEAKFMKTMQDIANLQDEKQNLEHLVLQLQGETETIGEYITLYQHQRGVLKQRAQEKELQLNQLADDREQMKQQLNQLNVLVKKLIQEQGVAISSDFLKQHEAFHKQTTELCEEHAKVHHEMKEETISGNHETAEKIIALLSEIKTSNLVQPTDIAETFHPCPLCSGKLITV